MSLKILSCLVAVLLLSVCGAFAAPAPLGATAPAVAQPMPVEDFVQALGNFDPSQPIHQAVVVSCAACSSNATCNSICDPYGFCGGTCKFLSDCQRKVCFCQLCP